MLVVAIVCFVAAIYAGGALVKAGSTGTARYYPSLAVPASLSVTRDQDPKLFQQAMLQAAFPVVLAGSVSAGAFYFFRRLSA